MRPARASIVALLAIALMGAPTPAGARCARGDLAPQALTHPADVIPTGASVTLAWVDGFGRVSKPSAAVSVVEKAP